MVEHEVLTSIEVDASAHVESCCTTEPCVETVYRDVEHEPCEDVEVPVYECGAVSTKTEQKKKKGDTLTSGQMRSRQRERKRLRLRAMSEPAEAAGRRGGVGDVGGRPVQALTGYPVLVRGVWSD